MGAKGTNNRQKILQAADRLFHVRGYNQTSFSDISDVTGIPRGNFYYYFKTKEDILTAVVDVRVKVFKDMLEQYDNRFDNPVERLVSFIRMPLENEDSLIQYGCPVGSLSTELAKDSEELREKSKEVFSIVREWMVDQYAALGIEDGQKQAMDLLARMQGISTMCCAFQDRDYLHQSVEELEDQIRSLRVN